MRVPLIVLAGATGNLGNRIAAALRGGASVRALVRRGSTPAKVARLREFGAEIAEVDYTKVEHLAEACVGAACVVSALSGLRDVIVDAQTILLAGAVSAEVPRFIPSDFCIDYTRIRPGTNRNLDLRREFNERIDREPIAVTTIFTGMFMDLLAGQAPVILKEKRRVLHWGDGDQPMDFTTVANTATFTAAAAMEESTPRYLRIAGDEISARGLAAAASEVTGEPFRTLRPGGLRAFNLAIALTKLLAPGKEELYPAWQGMQYLRDMLSGRGKLHPLDNSRYREIDWTSVPEFLAANLANPEMRVGKFTKAGQICA
jgi:nucleoside-diphosphate-sugar epimerase